MTPETNAQIGIWRQAAIDGTLSVEDMQKAIIVLRQDRIGASIASDKSRSKKAKSIIPSADDLLAEMEGL